jgi:hypothetical protein
VVVIHNTSLTSAYFGLDSRKCVKVVNLFMFILFVQGIFPGDVPRRLCERGSEDSVLPPSDEVPLTEHCEEDIPHAEAETS